MKHIERLRKELEELQDKINNLETFLECEILKPNFTDEIQRIKLSCQLEYMLNYAQILQERIAYDSNK